MRIIIKNIIKNVLSNKRRTLALILCMTVAAFSSMLSFSVSNSVSDVINGILTQEYGDAVISANNEYNTAEKIVLPENAKDFYITLSTLEFQKRSADNFVYPTKKQYTVLGIDVTAGTERGYFPSGTIFSLNENEIIISKALADAEELDIGDTIEIKTPDDEYITLTVKYITPNERFIKSKGACCITDAALAEKLNAAQGKWSLCYISVADKEKINEAYDFLTENNPDFTFDNIYAGVEQGFREIFLLFFGIFLVLALIIFIVTSGISEHIIRERMSELGTLRSLGATKKTAALALIAENLFYGLCGALLGILLYIPVHTPMMNTLVRVTGDIPKYRVSPVPMAAVVLITTLLSCGSSLKAVLRAVKTPIRDIIFGNRDAAYTLKKRKCYTGAVLTAAGLLAGLLTHNSVISLISLIMFTAGAVLFIPYLLYLMKKLSEKTKDPITKLSLINIATKKTNVSSAVMFSAVIGLVTAVLSISLSIGKLTGELELGGDIVLYELSMKEDNYRFIAEAEGVKDSELIYRRYEFAEVNGNTFNDSVPVIGYGEKFRMYNGVRGLPDTLAEDEVSLDEMTMKKLGINVGDTVDITLNAKGERPIKLKLTAVQGCDTTPASAGMRNGMVINLNIYKKYFFDYPNSGMISLEDPDRADETINMINTCIMDKQAHVWTFEEYGNYCNSGDEGLYALIFLIIFIGCILSLVLLSTNQSIGFEQRRKEIAVLHSTSMSRKQLKKLLFRETAYSILFAVFCAFLTGFAEFSIIMNFVSILMNGIDADVDFSLSAVLIFLAVMYLLTLITAAGSGKRLNKMNTAEEMKYE